MKEFFTFQGRLRRRAFWGRVLGLYGMAGLLYAVFCQLAQHYAQSEGWMELLTIVLLIATTLLVVVQTVKRLHDVNLAGWWWWLLVLPIVGNLFGLGVSLVDGSSGANRFGPDPKGRIPFPPPIDDVVLTSTEMA